MRHCAAVAGLIAVAVGPAQSRSPCYLAEVGPPTLRFDSPERGPVVPTEFSYNESKPPIPQKVEPPASSGPATNSPSDIATGDAGKNLSATNSLAGVAQPTIPFGSDAQTSGVDPSIVTPLTILEYLQPMGGPPVPNGKGAAVLIPVNINFTPPVRANVSSTAIYKRE